ncbi:MAG: hypothetical protein Q7T82_01935 [Armatimonadota bacterium]|nr:hypothetical protein [Armatimonadota bacterium]
MAWAQIRALSRLTIAVVLVLCLVSVTSVCAQDPIQKDAARKFLTALFNKDMKTVRQFVPARPKDLFGPFAFKKAPSITDPIVRGSYAMFQWNGQPKDDKLAKNGSILLRRINGKWLVRQVYCFPDTPREVKLALLRKSEIREDGQAVESSKKVAEDYLRCWSVGDYETMKILSYDWTTAKRKRQFFVRASVKSLSTDLNALGETIAAFVIKFNIPFIDSVQGSFVMIKEDNAWTVRMNSIELHR